MKKPGIFLGALVSGLLTLPLLAILYLGQQIAGFPFVPFGLFINVRDYTPGGVITFVIDQMISVISNLNLGRTDTVAKSIEISMGIVMVLVITIIGGALFFAYLRRQPHRQEWQPGVIYGLIIGVPLTIVSLVGNQVFTADPAPSAIWLLGLFLIWGYANNWAYNRLTYSMTSAAPDVPTNPVSVTQVDRRQFLITLGGATAAITVVGALVGSMAEGDSGARTLSIGSDSAATPEPTAANLPNAAAKLQPAPGTRAELTDVPDFYRIDISLVPPSIDGDTWTLPWFSTDADGNETKFADLTMNDIRTKFKPVDQYITQGCISNRLGGDLISTVKMTGASMQDVLKEVKPPEGTTHLLISGADGFFETLSLDQINSDPSIMLVYAWADQPLPERNGFPLRIHISDLYGMKQPKWITKIAALNHDVDGYWVVRGWDKVAQVRAVSVIDTVATRDAIVNGDQKLIPVGGIAWAGARGISKVEVSVDGGDWAEAQLRDPLSKKTWVLWRYDWPFAEGTHRFAVRCTDGTGQMQITDSAPEHPSGATGIFQVNATVA
jgi:DMSO/TMAO reductase YedYZ molybdopterin-dependent catalytic subunit